MNKCVISGKVLEEIKFDFIYNSKKHVSIAKCPIKLNNDSVLNVFGLDDEADYMYRHIKAGDIIVCYGKIRRMDEKLEVEVIEIEKVKFKTSL
mgnify:FL=1